MPVLMGRQLDGLERERLALMSQAMVERARLRAALAPADALAAKVTRVREKLFSMGVYPVYIGLAAVALVFLKLRPAALGVWAARGLTAWRLYEEVRRRLPGSGVQR